MSDDKQHMENLSQQIRDLHKQREWVRKQIEAKQEKENPSQVIKRIKLDPDILIKALSRALREDMGLKIIDPILLWTLPGGNTLTVDEARDIIFISRSEWARVSGGQSPGGGRPAPGALSR